MKKAIFLTISFFFLLLTPQPLNAQTDSPKELRKQLREERLENVKEKIAERKASQEAKLTDLRKEKIKSYFSKLQRRLLAAIERLEKLIDRIESRLAKIKEENGNVNTTQITTKIAEAKQLLESAKADLQTANDNLDDILESDDPKEAFGVVRSSVKSIKEKLVQVHRILVHFIGDIKGLRVGKDRGGSTPTPTI